MSALAKVFVVLNLLLSLLFFGTSATLFLTRQNKNKEIVSLDRQLKDRIRDDEARMKEQAAMIQRQDNVIVALRGSEKRLSVAFSTEREKVGAATTRAVAAESQRQTAQEESKASKLLADRREATIQDLNGQLEEAKGSQQSALDQAKQAVEARNRMKTDLDRVNQQLRETQMELADLATKYDKLELANQWYSERYGAYVPGQLAPPIDALVEAVDSKLRAVVLSVGEDQKVELGHMFYVYRDDKYIGKVKVTKLYQDLSGATVELEAEGEQIRAGDKATTRFSIVN